MKIYIGTDHRGFKLKNIIKTWFEKHDILHEDMGAFDYDPNDDYTLFAEKVASVVAKEHTSRGILICGSGVGVDIAANKFDGVRASVGKAPKQIEAGRRDDDMNILVIASDYTDENQAKKMVNAFLETNFDNKSSHKRRLEEISRIEQNN